MGSLRQYPLQPWGSRSLLSPLLSWGDNMGFCAQPVLLHQLDLAPPQYPLASGPPCPGDTGHSGLAVPRPMALARSSHQF